MDDQHLHNEEDQQGQELNFKPATKAARWLVAQAQKGDEEAINRLIELHYKDMLYFAIKQVGHEDGQDVTQKAIGNAIRKINDLRDQSKFKPWIMRAVHNECIDFIRKKKRQADQVKVVELHDESQQEMIEDRAQVFDKPFVSDIENEQLLEALDSMPSRFSNCIRLRYLEDMSYAEIAQTLGINEAKVKNDLHRGMKLLQQRFEDAGGSQKLFAATPAALAPMLTQLLQNDQAHIISPQALEQGIQAAQQSLVAQSAGGASQSLAAAGKQGASSVKMVLGSLAATLVLGGVLAFALTQSPTEKPANTQALEAQETTPQAAPPTEDRAIKNIADMIGTQKAEELSHFEAQGVSPASWSEFLNQIGASADISSNDGNYVYRAFLLTKQDKQLLLVDRAAIGSETNYEVRSKFTSLTEPPSQMEVVFMFE